jgi:pilus assembly protein Flp/PilA
VSLKIPNRKEANIMLYIPHEEGQGLVEYALILVLVAIVVITILTLLGTQVSRVFSRISSGLAH